MSIGEAGIFMSEPPLAIPEFDMLTSTYQNHVGKIKAWCVQHGSSKHQKPSQREV